MPNELWSIWTYFYFYVYSMTTKNAGDTKIPALRLSYAIPGLDGLNCFKCSSGGIPYLSDLGCMPNRFLGAPYLGHHFDYITG